MNIINIIPNATGGYPPIQSWSGATPPDGYAEVNCDTAVFYEYRGFVNLIIEGGKVTGMTGNQAALDAYLAEYPDTTAESEPSVEEDLMSMTVDHEYRLTLLELGVK